MLIELLEHRRLYSATHYPTFVEGATEFAVIVLANDVQVRGAGSQQSQNRAIVLQATPLDVNGQPIAIFVANANQTTLVVPGQSPAIATV